MLAHQYRSGSTGMAAIAYRGRRVYVSESGMRACADATIPIAKHYAEGKIKMPSDGDGFATRVKTNAMLVSIRVAKMSTLTRW